MDKKVFFRKKLYIFIIAYAVAFALYYAAVVVYDLTNVTLEWLEYSRFFYLEAVKFILPTLAGVLMIAAGRCLGTKYALTRGWVLSVPLVIYAIPSYYLYYLSTTYDSLEAIVFALINTVFDCAVLYLQTVATYFLVRFIIRLHAKRARGADLSDLIDEYAPYDLSRSFSLALFITVAIRFLVLLVIEIVETVGYIGEYSGNYRIEEIIYMALSYIFLLGELLFAQWFSLFIKDRAIKNFTSEVNEND